MSNIEQLMGSVPPGVKVTLSDGSLPRVKQTVITLEKGSRKFSGSVQSPFTDDQFFARFSEIIELWKKV